MATQDAPSDRLADQVFKALASPEVRLLLEYLRQGDRNYADIKREIAPAIGERLVMANLVALGLATELKKPRGSVFQLNPTGLDAIRRWLDELTTGTSDNRT